MADPNEFDDVMPELPRMEPQVPEQVEENLLHRLFFMLIIAAMISLAGSILVLLTVLQFIMLVIQKGKPNERLAEVGTDLGVWIAKSARYQTAGSETKPWPWTDFD
jgi:hypothetical protein